MPGNPNSTKAVPAALFLVKAAVDGKRFAPFVAVTKPVSPRKIQ